tara:strand:- start:3616 stop:4431 length:816 start_codon:yes stop_codon:yes gene_type:complete
MGKFKKKSFRKYTKKGGTGTFKPGTFKLRRQDSYEDGQINKDKFLDDAEKNDPVRKLIRQGSDNPDNNYDEDLARYNLNEASEDEVDKRPSKIKKNTVKRLASMLGVPLMVVLALLIRGSYFTEKSQTDIANDLLKKNKEAAIKEIKRINPEEKIPQGAINAAEFAAITADGPEMTIPNIFSGELKENVYSNKFVQEQFDIARELEKKAIKARNLAVRRANEVKNVGNIKKLPFPSRGKGTSKKSKHAKKPKSSKNPKLYKKKAKSSSKKK